MREIKSGGQTMQIRASNLTRMYYYQEFGVDIGQDLDKITVAIESQNAVAELEKLPVDKLEGIIKLQNINNVPPDEGIKILENTGLDKNPELMRALMLVGANGGNIHMPGMELIRVTWAMNKSQNTAENIQTLPFDQWLAKYDDFDFEGAFSDIYLEIARGFFCKENNGEG